MRPIHHLYRYLAFAMFANALWSQRITPGIAGGAGLTYSFQSLNLGGSSITELSYPQHRDYLVGPSIEVSLFRQIAFEFDAVYRPLNFANSFLFADGTEHSISPATVVTWEFPLLLKYRFRAARVSYVIEGGPSFRTAGNLNHTAPSNRGATVGAGVELRPAFVTLAPVLRYTRWAEDRPGPWSGRTAPNQIEFVLGISFRRK